jgi:hypothetical protein
MSDTTVSQWPKDIVAPIGHYNDTITWHIDSTTLLPIGTTHTISYPPISLPDQTVMG